MERVNKYIIPGLSIIAIPILVSITILAGTILASNTVSANDTTSVVDEINITIPVSCTLSGTGMNTHNANINNGLYVPDIGSTTLHAFCNDNEGFAIYAAGYTGNEIGGESSNKLVGTTASSNATIVSGTATTAGNPDISNWAMKLAISQDSGDTTSTNAFTIDSAPNVDLPSEAEQSATSTSFSDYHTVPNEYVKVAHKNSMTDMTVTAGGVKLTTTYAAYISKTQPADTYTGQVIYTLVHPASAVPKVPVSCNPTGTTIGTNSGTDIVCMQDITSANRNTVMASMTPERQYMLRDKRDGKFYTVARYWTVNHGKNYQRVISYHESCNTVDGCDTELLNGLSSEWIAYSNSCYVTKTDILCDEFLRPTIDNDEVWMTQNLDLDIDSSRTYTSEDTDLGWNTSTSQYDTASWTPTRSTYATAANNIHEWCAGGTRNTQYGYCENNNTPESYDPGDLYWNTTTSDYTDWDAYWNTCDFSTSTPTCTGTSPLATYVVTSGTPQYHLGNYYNWAAAIASNDASVYGAYNETSGQYENLEANQSICPAGWTLPYISSDGSTSDFATLWTQYGWDSNSNSFSDITNLTGAPLYSAPSGYFLGALVFAGHGGGFWSSIARADGYAGNADFGADGYAILAGGSGRYVSLSVRCLLR